MSFFPPTTPTLTTQDKIVSILVFILILIFGWASIEILLGILQLLFAPKNSEVKKNAPRRIKLGCLTLMIGVITFFLLGLFFSSMAE